MEGLWAKGYDRAEVTMGDGRLAEKHNSHGEFTRFRSLAVSRL